MGPDGTPTTSNIITPPRLTQCMDQEKWWEDVREWIQTAIECADGGHTRPKGAEYTFYMLLYRSLDLGNKERVKKTIRCDEIILKEQSNTEA